MNIDSLKSGNMVKSTGTSGTAGSSGRNTKSESKSETVAKVSKGDVLELSQDARELQIVHSRMKSGFYNKPEIVDSVAHKLSQIYPPESK